MKLYFSILFFVLIQNVHSEDCYSAYEYRYKKEMKASKNPFGIALYGQNYFMPAYYNFHSHHREVTQNPNPSEQMRSTEFRAQLSVSMKVLDSLFNKDHLSLHAAFTQVYFWQLYVNSAFFRETNYRPEFFIKWEFARHLQTDFGVSHESNGQGGLQERSQNKAYVHFIYHNKGLLLKVHFWNFILQGVSSNKYNPDIERYLGNLEVMGHYKFPNDFILSASVRNLIESHGRYSSITTQASFPVNERFRFLVFFFSGYAPSLIEYNKDATSLGIGLALNDVL